METLVGDRSECVSVYKSDGDKKQTRLLLGPFLFSRSKRDNARFQRDIEIMLGLTETEFFRRFLTFDAF